MEYDLPSVSFNTPRNWLDPSVRTSLKASMKTADSRLGPLILIWQQLKGEELVMSAVQINPLDLRAL